MKSTLQQKCIYWTQIQIPKMKKNVDNPEDDESDVDESYMIVTHLGNSSEEEESMEEDNEDEDNFSTRLRQITRYDKVLTIVTKQKKENQPDDQTEDEEAEEDQDEDQDQETEDQDFQNQEDHDDSDDDQHGAGQTQARRENQPEDSADKTEREEPKQQQDHQQGESKMDTDVPILKEVKFEVKFEDQPKQPTCELTRQSFATSICKVLPDTAEFPEDIFNIEGCIWCGSKGHDVYNLFGICHMVGRYLVRPSRRKKSDLSPKTEEDRRHVERS